jgi:hypothetical protein
MIRIPTGEVAQLGQKIRVVEPGGDVLAGKLRGPVSAAANFGKDAAHFGKAVVTDVWQDPAGSATVAVLLGAGLSFAAVKLAWGAAIRAPFAAIDGVIGLVKTPVYLARGVAGDVKAHGVSVLTRPPQETAVAVRGHVFNPDNPFGKKPVLDHVFWRDNLYSRDW